MPKQKHAFPPQQTLLIAASTVILVVVVGMFQFGRMKNERSKPSESKPVVEMATLPKATLVPIDGTWKKVTIHRPKVTEDMGSPAYDVSFSIPKTWSMKEVNIRPKADFDGADCKDYQIQDEKKEMNLLIKGGCKSQVETLQDPGTVKITDRTSEIFKKTIRGVSGPIDLYTMRFPVQTYYRYGEIAISSGKSIDLKKNSVFQCVSTSYDCWIITINSKNGNILEKDLQIADTIVSSITSSTLNNP